IFLVSQTLLPSWRFALFISQSSWCVQALHINRDRFRPMPIHSKHSRCILRAPTVAMEHEYHRCRLFFGCRWNIRESFAGNSVHIELPMLKSGKCCWLGVLGDSQNCAQKQHHWSNYPITVGKISSPSHTRINEHQPLYPAQSLDFRLL